MLKPSDKTSSDAARVLVQDWMSGPVSFLIRFRAIVKFFLTMGIFVVAYLTAFLIRFELVIPGQYLPVVLWTIPVLLVAKSLAFKIC
jgi:hypothetical protein